MGWNDFCKIPIVVGNQNMVYEFIVNSIGVRGHVVKVRNTPVSFRMEVINEIYHLPTFPKNQFSTFLNGNIDYDEVANVTIDGLGTWEVEHVTRKWIRLRYHYLEAHVGMQFICARLIPYTNH
ncbi:hypothetical protein ACH5RR_015708 [Cinchona calisaya]|uniref:Uncharacterized protein n=1 Tax=Cinchona calisaya TaxID=153742 RepID=A0ABD2ZUT1_9GENT